MATARMDESWRHVKSQIRTLWREVDFGDDELKETRGSLNKVVNLIHEKTGAPRKEIMQKITTVL